MILDNDISGDMVGSNEIAPPNNEKFCNGAMNGDGSIGPLKLVEVDEEEVPDGYVRNGDVGDGVGNGRYNVGLEACGGGIGRDEGCWGTCDWANWARVAVLSNEEMDGWDDDVVDELDDEREATVNGGGRFDSASVSFGSGDSVGMGFTPLAVAVVVISRGDRVRRSGDEEGEGGVVDVVSSFRFTDRLGGGRGGSSPSSLQSHAALTSRLIILSPPSATTRSSSSAIRALRSRI